MGELTAEMVEEGRVGATADRARRRRLAHDMRTAREKLTSSVGLERSFELELTRSFAAHHVSGVPVQLALVSVVAAIASLWIPAPVVAGWFCLAGAALFLAFALSRRFLRQDGAELDLADWRRRFAAAEFVTGTAWALAVYMLALVPARTGGFALFAAVMVSASVAVLSASLPVAVYVGLVPLGVAIVGVLVALHDLESWLVGIMASAAIVFFVILARRLHDSALEGMRSRVEKDGLFTELAEAKANSDEARRRAEEANLAKSRFLATMSHELRTPLNAILGFSEVMANEVFGPHATAAYREYSGDIHGSGQHLLTLINEILDLSRIEAGRYELAEEAVQLAWIVADCSHMLEMRAAAKGQTIREHVDTSLPRLWIDERAIRQVVLNILSNAIKFTQGGGEITIKVGWTSTGGQYVSVRDNGPGIPEAEIPIVMSSFGRGSLAIKTAEQGSGLGLPIVKGLVDLHGGNFQLRSWPRDGTEVIVTLPPGRVMDALAPVAATPNRKQSSAAAA